MSGFPLYDNLIKDLPKKDLTVKQKTEFVTNINKIDEDGRELVYALIYYYYINNETKHDDTNPPYKGISTENENQNQNRDITWNLANFPIKLRLLLYNFMSMHIKKLAEDGQRSDQHI